MTWNIFLPQSVQSRIELEEIADAQLQIITPQISVPIIGIVQDGLLGAYNLTQPTMKIDWKSAMNIMSYTSIDDFSSFKKDREFTGSELFSLIIPPRVNTTKGGIEVVNGQIKKGYLSKATLGSKKPHSLIHLIWDQYGPTETRKFIDNTQKLINNFNMWNGFSVGIGDINVPKEVDDQLHILFETKKLEVAHLITEMENNPDLVDAEVFEQTIKAELASIRDNASKLIMANLQPNNNFNIMITSGSKGDASNMSNMGACIGQQLVEGKRIRNRYNGRTLQYFFQGNDTALARGFVERPYVKGADAIGFIFHNMGSREGLIDTAIKTAESGYIQRKLIKSLEDLSIKYDGTVRSSNNHIIQFVYGDNGIDTTRQAVYTLAFLEKGNEDIKNLVKFSEEELKNFKKFNSKDNDRYFSKVIKLRNRIRTSRLKSALDNITFDSNFMLPVNITNIINSIKNDTIKGDKLEPDYILTRLNDLLLYKNTKVLAMSQSDSINEKSLKFKDEVLSKTVFKFAMYEYMSPKICLNHKLNKQQFDIICDTIISQFNRAVVDPGEMVGVISGQSIGEPVTQFTLSTFHQAGIRSSVALGVPRMKELLSLSKNIKTPEMVINLLKEYRMNSDIVNKIASYLKHTKFSDIRKKIDIYYDPNPLKKNGFMEKDNSYNVFYSYSQSKNSCQSEFAVLPWLLRIELDREKMMEKDITLLDIKSKFCDNWEKRYTDIKGLGKEERELLERITQTSILSNSDNDKAPVIHIRFDMTEFNFAILVSFIDVFVDNFKLKGIANVGKISGINEEPVISFDNENQELKKEKQLVIYTEGINLADLRYINGIDLNISVCNDIVTIYEMYGIDAARAALLKEFKAVFVGAGNTVNYAHLEILADLMTSSGQPISIDRHGLSKLDVDPLARASFEKTVEQLINASVFGEIDHMQNVSSRIMGGLVIKGGTGLCEIILNTELLEKSEYTEDIEQKYVQTYNEVSENTLVSDMIKKEVSGIFIPE